MDESILELETRRQIYELVAIEPGLHLREIARTLKMNVGLAEYHLRYLVEHDVITQIKEEGYNRYYTEGKIGVLDKRLLALLRQEVPLKIVLFLLEDPQSRHKDILENVDIASSTLSYHLKKLVKKGVLQTTSHGEEKGFVVLNEKEIVRLLIRYRPGPKDLIDGFIEMWNSLRV